MRKLSGILLVDDDSTSNFLTERLLRQVVPVDQLLVAGNGAEGLAVLQQILAAPAPADAAPWLVLLDLNMPVLNGFGFLEYYQHLPAAQRQRVVVVICTTSVHGADLARLQRLPIAGLVPKPLTAAKVTHLLAENLPVLTPGGGEPPAHVFQLLYRSVATWPPIKAELYHLLSQARQANLAAHITGLLVYRAGCFVQVLEGPETNVRALYAQIRQDPRHTQVVTVREAAECPRYFAHWSMALDRGTAPAVVRLFELALASSAGELPPIEPLLREVGNALGKPPS